MLHVNNKHDFCNETISNKIMIQAKKSAHDEVAANAVYIRLFKCNKKMSACIRVI